MSFFAEVLVEAIGWPVVIIGLALVLFLPPRRHSRRPVTVADLAPPPPSVTAPEPKAPRDLSRPYPRPGRTRSKLTRICPVCGMEDPGNLDGKVLGWPAHHSCAEWLGDWRPKRGQSGSTNTITFTGKGPIVASGGGGGGGGGSQNTFTPGQVEVSAMMAAGLISLDEARERIASAFSVPPLVLGDTWSVAGDRQPLITECFACGSADPDCPHRG